MKTLHLDIYEIEAGRRTDLHTTVLKTPPAANSARKKYAALLKATQEVDAEEAADPHPD